MDAQSHRRIALGRDQRGRHHWPHPLVLRITRTPKPYTFGARTAPLALEREAWTTYDGRSAFWIFRVVTNLVNLFYTATKDEVIPAWREWEDMLFKLQPAIEKWH